MNITKLALQKLNLANRWMLLISAVSVYQGQVCMYAWIYVCLCGDVSVCVFVHPKIGWQIFFHNPAFDVLLLLMFNLDGMKIANFRWKYFWVANSEACSRTFIRFTALVEINIYIYICVMRLCEFWCGLMYTCVCVCLISKYRL